MTWVWPISWQQWRSASTHRPCWTMASASTAVDSIELNLRATLGPLGPVRGVAQVVAGDPRHPPALLRIAGHRGDRRGVAGGRAGRVADDVERAALALGPVGQH